MQVHYLQAISPIDGRYHTKTTALAAYFSEFAWMRYRVWVEVEYFIALCHTLPELQHTEAHIFKSLRQKYTDFKLEYALTIKDIEQTTNHDIKAVEYFLKEELGEVENTPLHEFIHFGLTSQDINNTAIPMLLQAALKEIYLPTLNTQVVALLETKAQEWAQVPMLARTHGQPASPTRLGKEMQVFVERLQVQIAALQQIPFTAKFGGATGNFNAHAVAYPQIDWKAFADNFVASLGLQRQQYTTQIEHYDQMAALLDNLKRINTILIDFCRDIWHYVSIDYFKQHIKAGEVGSSAMPHKVNPIDFENAEGNLGIANANFEFLSSKLPISRLQRDLTDSTVLRNLGVPIAHTLIALQAIHKGIQKLALNAPALQADLENNWAVLAEAIQTVLRRECYPQPYEALKDLTRNHQKIDQAALHQFIDGLTIRDEVKAELKQLTPSTYLGL